MTLFIILIIFALLLWAVLVFNKLVTLRNRAAEAWADIDVQLKRRYDLIPNLVATVKAYAEHESQVFENVSRARAAAMGAETLADKGQAEATLVGALRSVFAVGEAYPDLKANQNFLTLQNELTDIEDKIQASRRFYNGNVRDLNTAIQAFPGNLLARPLHFLPMDLFQLEATAPAKEPVQVKF
jgi:LemA protein